MTSLSALLSSLADMGVDDLRAVWRDRFGDPPPVRSGDLLRRALAERLQEEAFGPDPELAQQLRKLSARVRPGSKPRLQTAHYQPGSLLVREWDGVRHEVVVEAGGYRWRDTHFKSLSAIAREITGVRWNGPRFFGLRDV
jgi:hypothetical protein